MLYDSLKHILTDWTDSVASGGEQSDPPSDEDIDEKLKSIIKDSKDEN